MSKGLLFWIVMLLILFCGIRGFFFYGSFGLLGGGMSLLVWVVIAIIGWQVFGPPVK